MQQLAAFDEVRLWNVQRGGSWRPRLLRLGAPGGHGERREQVAAIHLNMVNPTNPSSRPSLLYFAPNDDPSPPGSNLVPSAGRPRCGAKCGRAHRTTGLER